MELEIQVVPEIPIVVGGYKVLKQLPHQPDFYGYDPAPVVTVDPFSTKEVVNQ